MGLPPNPRSARPQGGRNRPPALAQRPSLSPSNPRGLGVQPSPNTTTCHPPDPLEPSRKHSPAGRKSAGSSGLASLCPAHAPPLASRASALALSTLSVMSVQAPRDSLYKNNPSTEDVVMLRTVKDFFEAFLKTPNVGIFPSWTPIRHGGEGGGGPTAGEAWLPRPRGAAATAAAGDAVGGAGLRRVGGSHGLGSARAGPEDRGSRPGARPRNHCVRAGRARLHAFCFPVFFLPLPL